MFIDYFLFEVIEEGSFGLTKCLIANHAWLLERSNNAGVCDVSIKVFTVLTLSQPSFPPQYSQCGFICIRRRHVFFLPLLYGHILNVATLGLQRVNVLSEGCN